MDNQENAFDQQAMVEANFSPELIQQINKDLPAFVNGSLSDLAECERKKQAALNSAAGAQQAAKTAVKEAKKAKDLSTGLFKNGKAIEGLKVIVASEGTAIDGLSRALIDQSEALKDVFDNQRKQATISRNLCLLGMGNQAVANTVLKRLKEGINGGELNNINEDVYQEFERIVMWWSQVEDMNAKIRSYEQRVADLQTDYDQVLQQLSDLKNDLKQETDTRLHSVDSLKSDTIAYKDELQQCISDSVRDLRADFSERVEATNRGLEEMKTASEKGLLEHGKQLALLQDDYSRYKGQLVHKRVFKTVVLILSVLAFILSVISLLV